MSEEKRKSIRDAYAAFKEDPTTGEEKLLQAVSRYKEDWTGERQKQHDQIWRTNVGFYAGNHNIRDTGPRANTYRVNVRENHTNNTINRMLSIFVQNLPVPRVFPSSISNDDLLDAETTELYAKYFWRTKKLELGLMKYIKYACIFGNGFYYRQFDPDLGGKMILDASESKSGEKEVREYRGDIRAEVDDPFRWAFRPGIDLLDEMYDCVRSVPANRAALEAKYGTIEGDGAVGYNAYTGTTRTDDDAVMQHHYFHKPTPWFEEGLYVCWTDKKLLKVAEYPYGDGKLPLTHLPFDRSPMSFYGMSSIEQIMDLQEQLDRAAGMIVEARNLIARPRVLASYESQVNTQVLTDRPGDVIKYKKEGGPPQFITPSFNLGELLNHKNDVRNALSQVTGITSASRGEIPAATRTALALQLVLEQDRSQYLPFIKHYHQDILDLMLGVVSLAAEYFPETDPRMIKIEGDMAGSSRTFHGGMVPDPLDMYLEDTNPLGWTAAGRAEQITNLVQMGVIKDRHQVLEMLKLHSADPAMETVKINQQAAFKENEAMKKGQPLDITPEDDDEVHLDEHTRVVASFSYRSLPKIVQDVLNRHIAQHKQRLTQGAQGGAQPGAGPKPKAMDPNQMAGMLKPPQPGDNIEGLLAQ